MYTNDLYEKFIGTMLRAMADSTKIMPGFETISAKILQFCEHFYAKTATAVEADETNCFVSLCHGDLHTKNVMFTNDTDDKPSDAIFVDYQVCFVGPAVTDLANIFYLSASSTLLVEDFEMLTAYYYRELSAMLTKLGYSKAVPTLADIQTQFRQRGICHVVMGLCRWITKTFDKVVELDEGITRGDKDADKDLRQHLATVVNDNETFKIYLKYFDQLGYFD